MTVTYPIPRYMLREINYVELFEIHSNPIETGELTYRIGMGLYSKLFNLACLKSKTKTTVHSILEFQYADNNSIAALKQSPLQQILTALHQAYTRLGPAFCG